MDHSEFGKYLTQQRELRGMSREDVSARTKIPSSVLNALELGQAERLPSRVFVVNYIRSYAQVIGLSPEEALLRYDEIHAGDPTEQSPQHQVTLRRKRAWGVLAVVGGVVLLAAAAFVLWQQRAG